MLPANFSLGQPASVGPATASGVGISGGFLGIRGNGLHPAYLSIAAMGAGAVPNSEGALMGVTCMSSMTVAFSKPMIASRLQSAVSVTLVRNSAGQFLNSNENFALNYNSQLTAAQITSSTGCWPSNTVFKVQVTSTALDYEGLSLNPGVTFYFVTLADPARDNVFTSLDDASTLLSVTSGTFNTPYFTTFNTSPQVNSSLAGAIAAANSKSHAPVVQTRSVTAFDSSGQVLPANFAPGQSIVTENYSDSINPGYVDGYGFQARVNKLAIYYLNQNDSLWVRAPISTVNTASMTVSAVIPYLSAYALIAAEDLSASDAYAYPVPFAPNGPNSGVGPGRSGSDSVGITFTNLPQQCSIEIFDVRGKKVWSGSANDGSGNLVWNVHNSSGEKVVTGVYLYVIKSSIDTKTGKLAVVR